MGDGYSTLKYRVMSESLSVFTLEFVIVGLLKTEFQYLKVCYILSF